MACYISSNDNRFYVAAETRYGSVAAASGDNRFPAVKLAVRQQVERAARRDKAGGRTYVGVPSGVRRSTAFELATYMTSWTNAPAEPAYGPLFQAALGGAAAMFAGGTVASASDSRTIRLSGAHHLAPGQAITSGGEIRFVAAIVDAETVQVNAPFSVAPAVGSPIGATATYSLETGLKSVSLYDCWSPAGAVQRILTGAAVDRARIKVNGDYHEFEFSGVAADLIDNSSFTEGQGDLTEFPAEPEVLALDYAIVPGHLGQAWLGAEPSQVQTLTSAELTIDNGLDLRQREFGSMVPRCLAAGKRTVMLNFSLFSNEAESTIALYQAARQRSPISVLLQLGQQEGQLFGIYAKSVVPEAPEFDDGEAKLEWHFANCRAQGTFNDELYVAFG
ncbi:MAG: hypothetical protein HY822_19370 [Acidobacteria bacterium]|nr:hypothetical protein [Acidobacteriota bacterium]